MCKYLTSLILIISCVCRAQFPVIPFSPNNSSAGLSQGLQAAWNFDDQFAGATNRFSDFGGQVFTNVNALTGPERSLTSGGVNFTNSGGNLVLTNTSMFGLNSSFTMAFWVCGGISGSDPCSIGQVVTDTSSKFDYRWDGQIFQVFDAGSVTRQVSGTSISATTWTLTVCGFDAANSQIFISNNGGARVNAACGSIRQTANMPFRISENPAVVDNFYFWNRVLTTAEITQLYNSGRGQQYPFVNTPGAQTACAWAWAITNLSGTVTANSISAMTTLIDAYNTAGILGRATCIIPFCPDSLQAALTSPLNAWGINGGNSFIAPTILPYEGRSGFVLGDLSVNGLTGNGSSKYVNLFPAPNDPAGGLRKIMPSPLDAGKIVYSYTTNAGLYVEEGYFDNGAGTPNYTLTTVSFTGGTPVQGYIGSVGAGVTTNGLAGPGFYSVQRVSNTELDGYFANSTTPHFLFNQSTTASGVSSWRVNFISYALFNDWDAVGGGPGTTYSGNTLSFFATFSAHLSASESAAAYAAVQAFRVSEGGGFR